MFAALAAAPLQTEAASKPNFVIINIDDMGYADIAPFGSQINRTPHLDRMAKEGRKLTSFYAEPVCTPSRAALMTGCYAKRALPIRRVLFPGFDIGLSPKEITIAELLKQEGYATAIIGKWHLGDQPGLLPLDQGFDYYFGLPYSNDMGPGEDGVKSSLGEPLRHKKGNRGQPPLPLMRNNTVLKRVLPDDQQELVEMYTKESLKFIESNKGKPFFLYLPHSAVHFPIYPGKKWAGNSPHGYYSDWVEEVDWSVGQVLDKLRQEGLDKNTLVLFTSDNGGTKRGVNTPLRGYKNSTWEGGIRVPLIAWWPDKIPSGTSCDAITGMFDILPTLAGLAGAKVPSDRKIDGADIWPLLSGKPDAQEPHDTFYYFRDMHLEAVRHQQWKLHLSTSPTAGEKQQLFNLKEDIGESRNLSDEHPEIVARLTALVEAMKTDLGIDEKIGSGCREIGRVDNAAPLLGHDGKKHPGLENR